MEICISWAPEVIMSQSQKYFAQSNNYGKRLTAFHFNEQLSIPVPLFSTLDMFKKSFTSTSYDANDRFKADGEEC